MATSALWITTHQLLCGTPVPLAALTGDAMLRDIESVELADNFDGSQQEPLVLPARIPSCWWWLLGVAVGMAN